LVREEDLSVAMAIAVACATEGTDDHHAVVKFLQDWSALSKRLATL
jgi:hypothetical protein